MADEFLRTYQSSDFEVLVQAEVLHRDAAGKFGKAPQQSVQRSGPYPQRPPEPAGIPPWRSAPTAGAMDALLNLQRLPAPAAAHVVPMASSAAAPPAKAAQTAPAAEVAKKAAPVAAPAMMAAPPVAPPSASQPKERRTGETEMEYLRRRLHNSQRAGRNRVYYHMLNLHGAQYAAKYWVDAPHKPPPKYANP